MLSRQKPVGYWSVSSAASSKGSGTVTVKIKCYKKKYNFCGGTLERKKIPLPDYRSFSKCWVPVYCLFMLGLISLMIMASMICSLLIVIRLGVVRVDDCGVGHQIFPGESTVMMVSMWLWWAPEASSLWSSWTGLWWLCLYILVLAITGCRFKLIYGISGLGYIFLLWLLLVNTVDHRCYCFCRI